MQYVHGMRFLAGLLFASALVGCSGGNFDVPAASDDTGTATDSSTGEASIDSNPPDSPVTDSGASGDSSAGDSSAGDSSASDTNAGDTAPIDAAPIDAGGVDSGPVCPQPESIRMWDTTSFTCSDLLTKLPAAVGEAKRCGCDADCSKTIQNDFCGCSTYVNPGNDSYTLALAIRARFEKLSCMSPPCPLIPCFVPVGAKCTFDSTIGGKICKDVLSGG